MKVSEYAEHDATALAELIRRGEVTGPEVQQAAREAIEEVDGELNALVGPLFADPLEHDPAGPFGGRGRR